MEKRINEKVVEFGGRKWKIKKFDAMTGSYIAYNLLAESLPFGMDSGIGAPTSGSKKRMSKEEFRELQTDCLKVCFEVLPAGDSPVLLENGNFGVFDLETDTKAVLFLTFQCLVFNISGFFDESLSSSLVGAMSDIFPLNAKI